MPSSQPMQKAGNAFFHLGTWDDETRKHEALDWMENYTRNLVDARYWEEPAENYHVRLSFPLPCLVFSITVTLH